MDTTNRRFRFLATTTIAITLTISNFAISKALAKSADNVNVAIVDVQKVVESSPEINSLKTERKNKFEDLQAFVDKAKADVAKETNVSRKTSLEEGYNKELNLRKDAMDKDYFTKISDIDKNLTSIINQKAKSLGYNLVLTKSSVISGGTDITSEIIKDLK